MKPTVIIINGPSASGKSSIQKAFQEMIDEPFLAMGIDRLFDQFFPDEHNNVHPKGNFTNKDLRWVEVVEIEGKPSVKLYIGPWGKKIIQGMHKALGAYANAGNHLVVDYILYDKNWMSELQASLKGVKVYWVGIKYPLEVIEEREFKRSTSPVGHARSHYYDVHPFEYDLVLEDSSMSSEELAKIIKDYVKENEPRVFESIG